MGTARCASPIRSGVKGSFSKRAADGNPAAFGARLRMKCDANRMVLAARCEVKSAAHGSQSKPNAAADSDDGCEPVEASA